MGLVGRTGVLVLDDDEDIRLMLGQFLMSQGYVVSFATNGRAALECVEKESGVQVVLLDISMPVMGGMEALRHIMNRNPHPAVIMITAIADREIASQAVKLGAFDYLVKPFDFVTLEASIKACLNDPENQAERYSARKNAE